MNGRRSAVACRWPKTDVSQVQLTCLNAVASVLEPRKIGRIGSVNHCPEIRIAFSDNHLRPNAFKVDTPMRVSAQQSGRKSGPWPGGFSERVQTLGCEESEFHSVHANRAK